MPDKTDSIQICGATIFDWPILHRQVSLVFPEIDASTLGYILRNELSSILLARIDGRIAGFCHLRVHEQDAVLWINYVGVLPEYRRRGIAQALLVRVEERAPALGCRSIELNVVVRNAGAMLLYEQIGFRRGDVLTDDKGCTKYRYSKDVVSDRIEPYQAPRQTPRWLRFLARILYAIWVTRWPHNLR